MGELDINIKKLKKNAYRVSKVRGETASRVRVPGGEIDHEIFPNNHHVFLKYIMKDVNLGPKCEMQGRIYWGGKRYDQGNELRKSMYRFSDKPAD